MSISPGIGRNGHVSANVPTQLQTALAELEILAAWQELSENHNSA